MLHKLATNENFDIQRGNQTVRVPFDATDPASAKTKTLAIKEDIPAVPVASVNGKTGTVVLGPDDVNALSNSEARGGSLSLSGQLGVSGSLAVHGDITATTGSAVFAAKVGNATTFARFQIPGAGANVYLSFGYNNNSFGIFVHNGNDEYFYALANATSGTLALLTNIPDVSGLAAKAPNSTAGNLAALDADGNPVDSGVTPGDKLDSTSAAPKFDATATYGVDKHVTYNGKLYRCTTAVTTAGAWNAANWTAEDMTTPDATLDVTSAGRLRLVDGDGTVLWQQGYDLASASAVTLNNEAVNLFAFAATTATVFSDATAYAIGDRVVYNGTVYKFTEAHAAGAWIGTDATEDPDTQAFSLPTVPSGKVGDFVLDIDNSANTVVAVTASLTGIDTSFSVVVPSGQSLAQMLTFAAGEMAELYFTQTAFKVNNLPTWKLVKQVVENGGAA